MVAVPSPTVYTDLELQAIVILSNQRGLLGADGFPDILAGVISVLPSRVNDAISSTRASGLLVNAGPQVPAGSQAP